MEILEGINKADMTNGDALKVIRDRVEPELERVSGVECRYDMNRVELSKNGTTVAIIMTQDFVTDGIKDFYITFPAFWATPLEAQSMASLLTITAKAGLALADAGLPCRF